jgi:hypothetical protein
MALLPVVFLIKNPTPHERVVMAGIWAYMALNTAGMGWCLWGRPAGAAIHLQPVSELLVSAASTGKPWLQRSLMVIFGINLGLRIATRFMHAHHGQLTGPANVSNWIIIGCAALVLVMKLWPLPPVKAGQP